MSEQILELLLLFYLNIFSLILHVWHCYNSTLGFTSLQLAAFWVDLRIVFHISLPLFFISQQNPVAFWTVDRTQLILKWIQWVKIKNCRSNFRTTPAQICSHCCCIPSEYKDIVYKKLLFCYQTVLKMHFDDFFFLFFAYLNVIFLLILLRKMVKSNFKNYLVSETFFLMPDKKQTWVMHDRKRSAGQMIQVIQNNSKV